MNNYELIATILSVFSLAIGLLNVVLWFTSIRDSRKDRKEKFYQQLINVFFTHNWRIIEYWDNEGVRPHLEETRSIRQNAADFGKRLFLLDHLNILWQVYLHKDLIDSDYLKSWSSWAESWFEDSRDQLKTIFEKGDLYPLDYIVWLKDHIFRNQPFNEVCGSVLRSRLREYEK